MHHLRQPLVEKCQFYAQPFIGAVSLAEGVALFACQNLHKNPTGRRGFYLGLSYHRSGLLVAILVCLGFCPFSKRP
jgi:hypothetical protein